VSVTDADSDLSGSATTSETTSTTNGKASFSNLIFTGSETGDSLAASLALTATLNVTAVSSTFNLVQVSQAISFDADITQYAYSPSRTFTVSATASSKLPVSFVSITGSVCSVSGTTVTILSAGTCSIWAVQDGNATYRAALPAMFDFTITQATQTIRFTPVSPQTDGVAPITLTATGGGSGNPVTFSRVSGPGSLSGANNSVLTVTCAGTIVIAANQAGNANYLAAAQVTAKLIVNPASR